jgi:hypothetical protein
MIDSLCIKSDFEQGSNKTKHSPSFRFRSFYLKRFTFTSLNRRAFSRRPSIASIWRRKSEQMVTGGLDLRFRRQPGQASWRRCCYRENSPWLPLSEKLPLFITNKIWNLKWFIKILFVTWNYVLPSSFSARWLSECHSWDSSYRILACEQAWWGRSGQMVTQCFGYQSSFVCEPGLEFGWGSGSPLLFQGGNILPTAPLLPL